MTPNTNKAHRITRNDNTAKKDPSDIDSVVFQRGRQSLSPEALIRNLPSKHNGFASMSISHGEQYIGQAKNSLVNQKIKELHRVNTLNNARRNTNSVLEKLKTNDLNFPRKLGASQANQFGSPIQDKSAALRQSLNNLSYMSQRQG